jgi:hypothetical protein
MNYISPDLKKANLNFHHRMPKSTFCAHMHDSMCRSGSNGDVEIREAPRFLISAPTLFSRQKSM